jgi:hypothetical protein
MLVRGCVAATFAVALIVGPGLHASGPVGIYGIVEKVVFEPDEANAVRLQVWGAFAFADPTQGSSTRSASAGAVTRVARGYMYFSLPTQPNPRRPNEREMARREWSDLKAVSGTGQAIGFGEWGYVGRFEGLDPSERRPEGYVPEESPVGHAGAFRVRPAAEAPDHPIVYRTNAGIVKLADSGGHADVVRALREALKKR